jgi:cytochrome c oxidase subunit 2
MRMKTRSLFASSLLVAGALFLARSIAPGAPAQPPEETKSVQIIEVTAKKYEFNPSPIRVKQGTKVQLKITATDHAHGFKIKPFPEGSSPMGSPGLVSLSLPGCQKIEKHQTATIEFVAQTAGTYPFKCCTVCGWHHRAMKGELIVEP